jgi:hypothetical protein
MNGLKLMLEQSSDALILEQYHNGWTQYHYLSSVLCFCLDSTIPITFINISGSVHDSQIADYGGMYDKLESMYLWDGAKCTISSVFGNLNCEFLIKLSREFIQIENDAEQRIACDMALMRPYPQNIVLAITIIEINWH